MSFEKDFENYITEEDELAPEDVFQMVTIMPKRKIKMTAHLEDKDGQKITLATIATNLKNYIDGHMENVEDTPVNTQLFPLINQMMVSAIPRHVGLQLSSFLFAARGSRQAISVFGLQIALLMRYIQQHELKIVTEQVKISDKELEDYLSKEAEANSRLRNAIMGEDDDPSGL